MDTFPNLWPAVEAGLGTCATLLLAEMCNPVALIYVGASSAGKTTVASMFEGAESEGGLTLCIGPTSSRCFFCHSFSKSNRRATCQRRSLTKIQYKVLLTPQLSTIFRGKPDELAENFSVITRVLDGQGLTTDSGTHGQRGYTGDYPFAWIGCTTPFNGTVWEVMAQLGSRLFFLVMDAGKIQRLRRW